MRICASPVAAMARHSPDTVLVPAASQWVAAQMKGVDVPALAPPRTVACCFRVWPKGTHTSSAFWSLLAFCRCESNGQGAETIRKTIVRCLCFFVFFCTTGLIAGGAVVARK